MLHPGDKEIAEYTMKGDRLSYYSALYKRRPASLMKSYQDKFVYGKEFDEQAENYVHLLTADFYFRSVYNFPFQKSCICYDDIVHKHWKALRSPRSPIITDMDGCFQVLLPSKQVVEVGTFHEAFAVFLKLVDRVGNFDFVDMKATVLKNQDQQRVVLYE